MPDVFGVDHRVFAVGTIALSVGVTAYAAYRMGQKHASKEQDVYESKKSLQEYLVFHYGSAGEILAYDFGPKDALHFPKRCAELCMKHYTPQENIPSRALDIGCAVGRSTFELTRVFQEAVGIDYSQSFVNTCQELKDGGSLAYSVTTVGDLSKALTASVSADLDRTKAVFRQGDACALSPDLGTFGCVLAANLVDRLHSPQAFLTRLADLVAPGGILVITTPYTFLRQFTPREKWIGGYKSVDGLDVTGFDGLRQCLGESFQLLEEQEMPFFIRETARKNQWTVSHATVWKRNGAV